MSPETIGKLLNVFDLMDDTADFYLKKMTWHLGKQNAWNPERIGENQMSQELR